MEGWSGDRATRWSGSLSPMSCSPIVASSGVDARGGALAHFPWRGEGQPRERVVSSPPPPPQGKMSAEVQRIRSACKALRLDKAACPRARHTAPLGIGNVHTDVRMRARVRDARCRANVVGRRRMLRLAVGKRRAVVPRRAAGGPWVDGARARPAAAAGSRRMVRAGRVRAGMRRARTDHAVGRRRGGGGAQELDRVQEDLREDTARAEVLRAQMEAAAPALAGLEPASDTRCCESIAASLCTVGLGTWRLCLVWAPHC